VANPVLGGFARSGRPGLSTQTSGTPTAEQMNSWYQQPSAQPGYQSMGGFPPSGFQQAPSRYLTFDDVITRCVLVFGTLLAAGVASWVLLPSAAYGAGLLVAMIGALGLGLYIAFTGRANAVNTLIYAGLEGMLLGAISRVFNSAFPGIVVQAVTGTVMVALGVLVVYKTGAVRVTPRFTKVLFASTLGVFGLMIVNGIASIFHAGGLGLRDGNAGGSHFGLAVIFSLICIVVAAMNLVMDFDMVEQSVRRGVDERYGWYLTFGLLVTIVWLYLEILRLLSYLRDN